MRLVGADDLQARSAYQPVVHHQGARWIAYVGHHGGKRMNSLTGQEELNGTSILDVTDPKHPRYLHHIPGAEGEAEAGGAAMVRVCDGKTLPRAQKEKTYLLRTLGNLAHAGLRDRGADTLGRAGDDDDLLLEPHAGLLSWAARETLAAR